MDLEAFTEKMIELLRDKIRGTWEVNMYRVLKNNGVRKAGIILERAGDKFSPVIYLDAAYEKYQDGAGCNAALYGRRKTHFIFDGIDTFTAHSFRKPRTAVDETA